MKNYHKFSSEELAQDDFFIKWVKHPDLNSETFWKDWQEVHPYKREDVKIARRLVLYLNQMSPITDTDVSEVKDAIFERIGESPSSRKGIYWVAAASVLLAVVSFFWFFNKSSVESNYTAQVQSASSAYELIEVKNTKNKPMVVNLSDGSSVVIEQGSKLSYPKVFAGNIREVFFTGEGFFEIARNEKAPFIVRSNKITTKVLGTSFIIKSTESEENAKVIVRSGKVAVYTSDESTTKVLLETSALEGLVLTPGEEATYTRTSKAVTNSEKIVVSNTAATEKKPIQIFEDTQIKQVFNSLEEYYPIEVIYDQEKLGSCPITARLTDEPLLVKLDLICKAIQAEYTIEDNKVHIRGKGCK